MVISPTNPRQKQLGDGNDVPNAIDNDRFINGVARILALSREPNLYEACIATYGSEESVEKVAVSIVDTKHCLIIDHRTWVISEYGDEVSRSAEAAIDALTDDMIDYCNRGRVEKVFMVDKPFPLRELEERCPHCGKDKVRVPWPDQRE